MELEIPADIYHQMIEHCLQGRPNEACGFLAGNRSRVERIFPLTNEAASPVYYKPAGKEMIAAMNEIDDAGMELLAIFHSHVASAPHPSPTDIREAHYPGTVYLIVSLMNESPDSKGWLIQKDDWRDEVGRIEQIDLVVS